MSKKLKKNLNSPLRLAIVGAQGRMGKQIQLLAEASGFQIVAEFNQDEKWRTQPEIVDVVVEFSSAKGLKHALKWCLLHKKPLVSGTTGLKGSELAELRAAAKKIPILHSANMSLGVAVMAKMLEQFQALGDWDFQVDEVHHNQKKDRPSGTALLLDQRLSQTLKRKLPTPNSIRGGGVPGIHQVWAMGPEEVLVLQHTAFDRKVFARGALKAARWLFDKAQPGLYDITDLFTV